MHPLDCLFCQREVVDTICLLKELLGLFGWPLRLPLAVMLDQRNTRMAAFVLFPDQDGVTLAGDEHIFVIVHLDPILGKNGDVAVVSQLAYAEEQH